MTSDQAQTIQEIFKKRLMLVSEISRLNAEQLNNTQQFSGNQIELLRCSDNLEDQADSQECRDEFNKAEAQDKLLKSKISDCNEKLKTLEEQVAELDRQLETL